MKKIIYLEASPRKSRSHSKRVAEAYLNKVKENDSNVEIKKSLRVPNYYSKGWNKIWDKDFFTLLGT